MNPGLKYHPIGILNDDPLTTGRRIHGIEVLGGLDRLNSILEHRELDGLILAGLDPHSNLAQEVAASCREHGCWLRAQRLEFELVE